MIILQKTAFTLDEKQESSTSSSNKSICDMKEMLGGETWKCAEPELEGKSAVFRM